MKKGLKLLAVSMSMLMVAGAVSCAKTDSGNTDEKDYGTVNVGLQGNFGASAGFVGIEEGFFKEEGVTVNKQILTGPNIIQGLKGGTVDIGFLGNGVSWNYFVEEPAIKMLTLDNLSDDDRLIANPKGKGAGLTLTSDTAKLYEALKGSTVALDLSATPGTFFRSLLDKLNEGKTDSQQLWFKDLTDTYPSGITTSAGNEVTVSNTSNANITAAMSGDDAPDFCVAFAPISTTLVTNGFIEVAKTSTHMSDKLTPSTWAVSTSFYNDHKEALQAFTNGLVKSFDFRHNNVNGAAADAANQLKQDISAIVTGVAYWPSAKDLQGWFETTSGQGYTYINQIRNSQLKGSNLAGVTNPKTAEEVIDTTFLLNACKTYLGE